MTVSRVEAWITSAVEDKIVNKAIILAGSLRRVCTTKKLTVVTAFAVSQELREKLKEVFDLVLLLEQESPNGLNLEDYAKVQAFSLLVFNKCVYLSPNTLVLKNCDEIFEKYSKFAVRTTDAEVDSSVYLFTPLLDYSRALKKVAYIMQNAGKDANNFPKHFHHWIKNNIPHVEKLEEQYNSYLDLNGNHKSLTANVTIANFGGAHPLDLSSGKLTGLGIIEKAAIELYQRIYNDDIKSNVFSDASLTLNKQIFANDPIAIVGMSFRLPGGNNVDDFWQLLIEGKEGIKPVPPHRWTRENSHFPCRNRKVEGGFLDIPVDEFDSKFFGINPKEAEFLDPQQRLLHEITWEALEDAMINPLKLRGTQTGVFIGSWIYDYKDMCQNTTDVDFFRMYMGNSIAATAARLSHFFETTGPSIATESGCSSAMAAVDMACKSLRNGDSSIAIAGGVNLLLHPFDYKTLDFILAPDGRCKTFDAKGNGFARAEGCAVLLLKRLSDATRGNDRIWGLIRGSALTQEGLSKSLGTPTIHCESLAMELALKDAQVHPKQVSYIEAHGTGTSVGDPMEIAAITKAYYTKKRTSPLIIGSVKTNVGHTESVSGITGIIKVLLAMRNEKIPPHLNLETLNPEINLDVLPAQIPLEALPWPRVSNKPRIAGVSSFGISGTDGHAIIQEPPTITHLQLTSHDERPLHIMTISARSPESFEKLLSTYQEKFSSNRGDDLGFADIAYSANTGRATFNHRAVLIAEDFQKASKILKDKSYKQGEVLGNGKSLCFLFTGQGSQYPKMAETLYDTSPIFKDSFDQCNKVLTKRYGINLKQVLWEQSDAEELSRTLYSQTSIFCVEFCLLKLWESWGVKADYVMGHSLGEFAAAVAAGALDFEDALMLVAERSRLIDNLPCGKMLVIKADRKTVDQTIKKYKEIEPKFWADYAALNSSDQTVVAGDSQLIQGFANYCTEKSLKSIVLAATHAFHSRHMDPMLEAYRKVAQSVKTLEAREDSPKYISGMEGKWIGTKEIDADYWVRHTRKKVSFIDACKTAGSEGCTLFIEIGPHPVLSALAMMNIDGQSISCFPSLRRTEGEWVTMLHSLAKLYLSEWKGEIDWNGFDKYYKRNRVDLPFYPFSRKSVWRQMESLPPSIHPLIGGIVPTATGETIFEKKLTLKNTPFVLDHVIGNTVVFPGAGFLEMCLAGGHASVQGSSDELQKPRRPVVLKSLKITTPLALYDSKVCKLQTVAVLQEDDEEEIGYAVAVHRFSSSGESASGAGQWVPHATAKFLPIAPKHLVEQSSEKIDIGMIQAEWENSDNRGFYEKLPEVGLRFGPKFQSLEMGWKCKDSMLASVKVPEDNNAYLIHPVVADAMIQATMLWTTKEKVKKKLQVPIHIGEFVWLQSSDSSTRYIYCRTNNEGKTSCILVDEKGTHLAYMKDIELIETTVKLVEGMIHQQGTAMAKLWEEIWKYSPGPLQSSYDFVATRFETKTSLTIEQRAKYDVGPEEKVTYENICNLARLYFLNAYYQVGWKPQQHVPFNTNHLMKLLPKPDPHLAKYTRFFLRTLSDIGILKVLSEEEDTFVFERSPPSEEDIREGLKCITRPDEISRVDHRLTTQVGTSLADVLTGKVSPLQLLFPNDPTKADAADFYGFMGDWLNELISYRNTPVIGGAIDAGYAHYMNTGNRRGPPMLRILEVGAGTGATSKVFLDAIHERGQPYEYYYTDISAGFFNQAEKNLEKYLKHIIFKKLDMEEDPLAQGFCPGYFDIVYAAEVLHVSKDMRKTLRNIRSLLKPGGLIHIIETIVPDPRVTFFFGLLDGYWRFEDTDFRPYHTTLTGEKWEEALIQTGFEEVGVEKLYNGVHGLILARVTMEQTNTTSLVMQGKPDKCWIVCGDEDNFDLTKALVERLSGVNRKTYIITKPTKCNEAGMKELFKTLVNSVEEQIEGVLYLWGIASNVENRDQTQFSLPFVSLLQILMKMTMLPRIYVVTQGIVSTLEESEVDNPTPGSLSGIVRSAINEFVGAYIVNLELEVRQRPVDQAQEIFSNLWWVDTANKLIAFRDGQRLCARLTTAKIKNNEPLPLPVGSDRFQLVLPKTRLISDLEFGILDKYALDENEVEVEIKAMALNFRDVFTVLKPIAEFDNFNTVGLEFTGVVTKVGGKVTKRKVGDRVMGMNSSRNLALPSHIKVEEQLLVPVPNTMTFEEGVTLPAVFSTVVYCLVTVAQMKRGETLLIHTASGGVGLCAIQLAKRIGANIIATAGSPRKRNYLHSLGIEHVFNSRTTEFEKQILKVTNGRGVDIVLNSITGKGFKEASLNSLAKNGKFIEMSRLNVWKAEEVKELRPDVFYRTVDLTTLDAKENEELCVQLKEFLHGDFIRPIAYERFDAVNIRGALNYLQKAKHIGKIVCVMPEFKIENSKIVSRTKLFNEDSTYLVTGGLGGIGFEVVKWMLGNGAKHIAIASRSQPKTELARQIDTWNKGGKHVQAFAVDIGDFGQCRCLFDKIETPSNGFPKIRGVMHAAGVLQDTPLEDMTWGSLEHTFNPKVKGTWNLHDLTKDMLLEHFVLFSTVSAVLGTPMQANHCASNSFEDSFASYRRSQGLTATTINWGNWGEVGVATEIDFPGVRPISTSQGLLALEAVLKTQTSHICVLNIESFSMLTKIFNYLKYYLDDKRLFGEVKATVLVNSDEFWNEIDSAENRDAKVHVFKTYVKTVLRNILKMDSDETIEDFADFQALGVDSLMMLEMKNGMQNLLGTRMTITPAQIKGCNCTEMLANRLVEILEGDEIAKNMPTPEELRLLIREDSILPEHIQVSEKAKALFSPEIKNVLITGATGTLAPYLLRELSHRKDVDKIFCIIRKSGKESIRDKLLTKLQFLNLLDEIDTDKVICLEGDLTTPKFGLSDESYEDFSKNIDAIFHCAVKSDHTGKYWKAPETRKYEMRTVNVLGTLRALEFAVENKLKSFYHASTLLVMVGEGENGEYSEDWQSISGFDGIPGNTGYAISKFISEYLLRQAVDRGVPIKVFRFPHIAGDSRTGQCDYNKNHVIQRWLIFMKTQQIYDFPTPMSVMAVDHCAKLSLDIFLNTKAPSDIYNIVQRTTAIEQSLIENAEEFGISIETVHYSEFIKRIKKETETSLLATFKDTYEEEEETFIRGIEGSTKSVRRFLEDSSSCFDCSKMINFAPIYSKEFDETYHDVVRRDLLYIKSQGVFDKLGIKYKK